MELTTHIINFKTLIKSEQLLNYHFKFYNVYLIYGERELISTFRRKKRKSNTIAILNKQNQLLRQSSKFVN